MRIRAGPKGQPFSFGCVHAAGHLKSEAVDGRRQMMVFLMVLIAGKQIITECWHIDLAIEYALKA